MLHDDLVEGDGDLLTVSRELTEFCLFHPPSFIKLRIFGLKVKLNDALKVKGAK